MGLELAIIFGKIQNHQIMKKHLIPALLALVIVTFTGCSPEAEKIILTVTGPVPASEMGLTLVHEHVLVDLLGPTVRGITVGTSGRR